VGQGVKSVARRALLQQIAPQYHNAPPPQKKRLLEGFLAAKLKTVYTRAGVELIGRQKVNAF